MTFEERKRYAEVLLVCTLHQYMGKTFKEREVKKFINRRMSELDYDDFYREFYGYLNDPLEPYNILPIFFAVKNQEIMDLIHRRLYEYNSNQFYRVVVPVLFEFSRKVYLERSSRTPSKATKVDQSISRYLSLGKNPYCSITTRLFRDETEGDTFNDRIKTNFIQTLKFYKLLFDNIYKKLGGSIQVFDRIKDELQMNIQEMGVTVYSPLSDKMIDEFFFQVYFQNELKLLYKTFCHGSLTVEKGPHLRLFFDKGIFLYMTFLVGFRVPDVPYEEPFVNGLLRRGSIDFDESVRIVDRRDFLYRLWGLNPD